MKYIILFIFIVLFNNSFAQNERVFCENWSHLKTGMTDKEVTKTTVLGLSKQLKHTIIIELLQEYGAKD